MTPYSRLAATAVLLPLLSVAAGACAGAGEKSESDITADLSEEIRNANEGLTEDQADCMAEVIVEVVGIEELREVNFDDEDPAGDLGPALVEATREARDKCDLAPQTEE